MGSPAPEHSSPPHRLVVALSGGGRTLLNLQDEIDAGRLDAEVVLVLASRVCAGADRARARGLNVLVEPGEIPAERLGRILSEARADWLVLAGYLRLVHVPEPWAGRVVNIHPALLPELGGPGMYGDRVHKAALGRFRAGDRRPTGATVHLVDAEYDHGPIVEQRPVEIREDDTAETLAARVFEAECELYPSALRRLFQTQGRRR